VSFEEVGMRRRLVEGLENERKHNLLDVGDWEGLGGGDQLEGTVHQVRVTLGEELHPVDGRVGLEALGASHERDEPVLVKVAAAMESPKTKFLHRGRGKGSLGILLSLEPPPLKYASVFSLTLCAA
jgi:hypothetical protein